MDQRLTGLKSHQEWPICFRQDVDKQEPRLVLLGHTGFDEARNLFVPTNFMTLIAI